MLPQPYTLYPEITPFQSDWLKVSELHQIYYEQCGNPNGRPVVFYMADLAAVAILHSAVFLIRHIIVLFYWINEVVDAVSRWAVLEANTTEDLVADLNRLRTHLNIDRWLVFGGSWGSTLALSYALTYPSQVTGLILRGIFLSSAKELRWFLGESELFYPEPWQTLLASLSVAEQSDVLKAYQQRIFSEDAQINIPAAITWNHYESSIMSLLPGTGGKPVSDEIQLARARVQIHYIVNACFIGQYDFLNNVHQLSHIPTTIVQGRYDMVCPPLTAWQLKQAMPHAEFFMIPDAGHSGMETGTVDALISATEKFKAI